MSYKDYENIEYYNNIFKKDDLYYQVAIPLKSKTKLSGGIGIFREKNMENFLKKN
ncbi:hypothetical protein IMX26_03940 [Clostridium sp. 'deep sea']|uniref:hypothetical protein n=1 Tax=Clostridium sp. 'deep sea' TaxID=2779445 RepID=UPI0018966372|nr:hypothetical protein [Clostridium sp. 'deep sea']QOR35978.1 hypothetical protein IMX26_03940 [Clostridium sp. 'deep sea']